MIQTFTIEGFEPPTQQPNYHDPSKTDYSYWVAFKEFGEKTLVVKQTPSLQIGQQLYGEIIGKTSKAGKMYYRFKGAPKPDGNTIPTPAQAYQQQQTTVPTPNVAPTAPVKATEDLTMPMWAIEQAVALIGTGQAPYDALVDVSEDILIAVNKVGKKSASAEIVEYVDLPDDNLVKAVFSNPGAMPPTAPPDFLNPEIQ